jgi:hypothetical protein
MAVDEGGNKMKINNKNSIDEVAEELNEYGFVQNVFGEDKPIDIEGKYIDCIKIFPENKVAVLIEFDGVLVNFVSAYKFTGYLELLYLRPVNVEEYVQDLIEIGLVEHRNQR